MTTSSRSLARTAVLVPSALALLLTAACSSGTSATGTAGGAAEGDQPAACSSDAAVAIDAIQPKAPVGQGPGGEPTAATPEDVAITDAEAEKIKAGNFEVALNFPFQGSWTNGQTRGLTDEFTKYGVKISSITDANFKVEKQIADIENAIQLKPDGFISIPIDDAVTAPTYKKVGAAGIKLVFMDNVPNGLKAPADYQAAVSADSQGLAHIAAAKLACYIPEGGAVGSLGVGFTYFTVNQRTKGFKEWFAKNRPDVKVKEVQFTDPNQAGDVATNFLTANPDVKGMFAVWDAPPAAGVISALRGLGMTMPVTTVDLGDQAAVDLATGEYLKGVGAQRPYEQGVAEARAMMKSLIGEPVPTWIAVPALAVLQSNLSDGYQQSWKTALPKAAKDACGKAAPACQ